MPIKTTIHSIDRISNTALITVKDDDYIVLNRNNVPIELNPDGTANTSWLTVFSKYLSFHDRLIRLEKNEDDLL